MNPRWTSGFAELHSPAFAKDTNGRASRENFRFRHMKSSPCRGEVLFHAPKSLAAQDHVVVFPRSLYAIRVENL